MKKKVLVFNKEDFPLNYKLCLLDNKVYLYNYKDFKNSLMFLNLNLYAEVYKYLVTNNPKYLNSLHKGYIQNKNSIFNGWFIFLKLDGLGYRFQIKKNKLILDIGYSHGVVYFIPENIHVYKINKNLLLFYSCELFKLQNFVNNIYR